MSESSNLEAFLGKLKEEALLKLFGDDPYFHDLRQRIRIPGSTILQPRRFFGFGAPQGHPQVLARLQELQTQHVRWNVEFDSDWSVFDLYLVLTFPPEWIARRRPLAAQAQPAA